VTVVAAAVATALLTALAVLQVLVATGRPYGRLVWGGQHAVLPRALRVGSAISVVAYAAMATALVWRAVVLGTPPAAVEVATWVLVGYFALGVVVNAISRSRAEKLVMTPVCAVLALCSLVVASA
jgi:hypothetical protein